MIKTVSNKTRIIPYIDIFYTDILESKEQLNRKGSTGVSSSPETATMVGDLEFGINLRAMKV